MKYINLLVLLVIILVINIVLSHKSKKKFIKKYFPENIIYPLDESIPLPEVEEGIDTPKKIYRCHRDKNSIDKYKEVFSITDKLMPEYEQIFYDDEQIEEFIKNNFHRRIYDAYKSINPIYGSAKSDLFRMLIIYLYGGVYFDIKSGPTSTEINDIIRKNQGKNLISIGQNFPVGLIPRFHLLKMNGKGYHDWSFISDTKYNEYAQWFIISNKGNLIIKQAIKQIVTNIENGKKEPKNYSKGFFSVLALSGPICYSKTVAKYKNKKNCKIFYSRLNDTLSHHLIDYLSIEKENHYQSLKDKRVIL